MVCLLTHDHQGSAVCACVWAQALPGARRGTAADACLAGQGRRREERHAGQDEGAGACCHPGGAAHPHGVLRARPRDHASYRPHRDDSQGALVLVLMTNLVIRNARACVFKKKKASFNVMLQEKTKRILYCGCHPANRTRRSTATSAAPSPAAAARSAPADPSSIHHRPSSAECTPRHSSARPVPATAPRQCEGGGRSRPRPRGSPCRNHCQNWYYTMFI